MLDRHASRRPGRSVPFAFCLVLAAALTLGCASEPEPPPEPEPSPLADLGPGWNAIEPGGDTVCSDGSPYRFFVRVGDPRKLVFYLQGGGACWFAQSCDPEGEPTYKRVVEEQLVSASGAEPEEGALHGIFAFGHPDNPIADHSVVFAPYCTGDVHLGDRVATYTVPATDQAPERELTIQHKGWVNGRAVLDWTREHFEDPESIFVTGSSAGAIPSPVYARELAESYPEARIVQLGDGAGGYRNMGQVQPHVQWGTLDALGAEYEDLSGLAPEEFTFEKLYVTAGQALPDARLARYDTAEDETQIAFLRLSQTEVDSLQTLLDLNEADIDAGISNYASYLAPGGVHTILLRPELYSYEVNGVRFRDWLAALVAGEPVEDVHCGVCDQAPAREPASDGADGDGESAAAAPTGGGD